jgi:hypothetical protein
MQVGKNHDINCHRLKQILHMQSRHSNNTSNLINSLKSKQNILVKSTNSSNTSHCHETKKHKLPCNMTYIQSMELSSTKPKLTCRQLKKMLHAKNNDTNKISSKCVYTFKKTAKQIYIEQIEDTPKNKCGICKELKFEKNMRSIRKYLQKVYMDFS